MSKLDDSRNADEDLLSSMAFTALQMEYAKGGNGDPKKLYTKLRADDDSVLLWHIFNDIAWRNDIEGIEGYHMWKSTDSARLLKESAAKRFVKDFYGNDDLDLSEVSCFEDQGDGYWSFSGGDGDPWYEFLNYSIKENEDFYLLEGACAYGDVLKHISSTDSPQGIICICKIPVQKEHGFPSRSDTGVFRI